MKEKQVRKKRAVLLCLTGAVLAVTGCQQKKNIQDIPALIGPAGVDVDTAKVQKMDLSSVESFQGEIVPEIKGLYFVSSGNIGEMKVKVGDKVKKGQLLATLTSADSGVRQLRQKWKEKREENADANQISRYDIKKLTIACAELKKQYRQSADKKQKADLKIQIAGREEDIKLARLRFRHQKEKQQLELKHLKQDITAATAQTKESKLYSPVNGEVISTAGGSGYMVQGGVTAIQIADMEKPRIRTAYIGSAASEQAGGYRAVVNGRQYGVKLEEQEISQFDIEMGKYPSYMYFDFTEKAELKIGDSATIDLYHDMAEDALVVPSNAVFKAKKERYVYVMDGVNKKKTVVTTGTVTDAYTQILSGVREGDVVYVED